MTEERQSWVWITKKEYYLEEDGSDRQALDPVSEPSGDGSWWTCHRDTRAGDLVLLYRTTPKSDIAYLLEASTDARLLGASAEHHVVTMSQFPVLVERARAAEEAVDELHDVRQAIEHYEDAKQEEADAYEALRRHGWRLSALDEAEAAHDALEGVLIEREKSEGLDQVQADWDALSQQGDDLGLVQGFVEEPNALEETRQWLAEEVFYALDMPEDTILETDTEFKGRWVCGWESRYKLTTPAPIGVFSADGWLTENWNALRANFKGSFFKFNPDVWERVVAIAASNGNPELSGVVKRYSKPGPSGDIVSEHQIRDALADRPDALGIDGLSLYIDPREPDKSGVEYTCKGVGFIDLLMADSTGGLVVVELKTRRAGAPVIGQVAKYMGWVKQNLADGRAVRGVVVSDGYDAKYEAAASMFDLTHVDVSDLKARLGL